MDKLKDASDKAGKQVAKGYHDHQDKVDETKDARGGKVGTISLEYMGGYGDKRKAKGTLTFYQKQTEFSSIMSGKFIIQNSQVRDIVIEGKAEVNRRVTVTRLLTVGIFAFALKKKNAEKEAYLTIELADGQEIIFFIENKAPMELKAKLAKVISQVKQAGVASAQMEQSTQSGSVADELTKLAALKEQGIITQADFDKAKAELLH
jgi:hypothetical protein